MTLSNYNSEALHYQTLNGKSILDYNVELRLAAQNGNMHKLKFRHLGVYYVDADFFIKDADQVYSDFGPALMMLKNSWILPDITLLCAALTGIALVLMLINRFWGGDGSPYDQGVVLFLIATQVFGVAAFIFARKRLFFFEAGLERRSYSITGRLKRVEQYAYQDLYSIDVSEGENEGPASWSLTFKNNDGSTAKLHLTGRYGQLNVAMEYWLDNLTWPK